MPSLAHAVVKGLPMSVSPANSETFTVDSEQIACDGGGGALGHPRVYLTLVKGEIECPYCSRHYVLAADAKTHSH